MQNDIKIPACISNTLTQVIMQKLSISIHTFFETLVAVPHGTLVAVPHGTTQYYEPKLFHGSICILTFRFQTFRWERMFE